MFKKFLIASLIVIVLVTGVLMYVLYNQSFQKDQVSRIVENLTGRSLSIDGPLNIDLGFETSIEARGIRFSNPDWAEQAEMAEIGRLFVSVDLTSVWQEQFVINAVEIDDCRVDLVKNEKGEANWEMADAPTEEQRPTEEQSEETGEPAVRIYQVNVANCQFSHDAPERTEAIQAVLTSLEFKREANGTYTKNSEGVFDGIPWNLSGNMGPIRALWQGGAFDHEVQLKAGNIQLQSAGRVDEIKSLKGANVQMNFSGPEILVVTDIFALPPVSNGEFDFNLEFNTEGQMTEIDINGDLGSLEAQVDGELDQLLKPSEGSLQLGATGPDLGALLEAFGVEGIDSDAFNVTFNASVKGGRTQIEPLRMESGNDYVNISGAVGTLPGLHQSDLKVEVFSEAAERWVSPFTDRIGILGSVTMDAVIQIDDAGEVGLDTVVNQQSNQLKLSGGLGLYPTLDQPDFKVDFSFPDLASVGQIAGVDSLPNAPAAVSGNVSLREEIIHFDELLINLADNNFEVNGQVSPAENFKGSKVNLDASVPSLKSLAEMFGAADMPDQRLEIKSSIEPAGEGLKFRIGDAQMGDMAMVLDGEIRDLNQPALIEADFEIRLPSLAFLGFLKPGLELPDLPFSAVGRLVNQGGYVQLEPTQVDLGQTSAQIEAKIQPGEQLVGSWAKVDLSGADLSELVQISQLDSLPRNFQLSGSWQSNVQHDELTDIEARLGDLSLSLDGKVSRLTGLESVDLVASLTVPDISLLNETLGQKFKPQSLTASTSLSGTMQDMNLQNIDVKLGASDLSGALRLIQREKLHISGQLGSKLLDLRPFQKEEAEAVNGIESSAEQTQAPGKDKKVFDDTPMRTLEKRPFDIDLQFNGERALFGYSELENINIGLLLQDGLFRLSPLELTDNTGSAVSGSMTYGVTADVPQLNLKLDAQDLRLGLNAAEGQDPSTYPPVEIHVNINGAGATRHELATSLDGRVRVFWGSGLYAASGVGLIFSDFTTELLSVLNPFASSDEFAKLDCGVIAADIQSGQVMVEPILIQDEKVTIISSGEIDLDPETLDLTFHTKPRKGFGISAGVIIHSLVKVGGTLSSPGIELDAGGAAVKGGTAVATMGISLLARSFADRFLSSKDPCGDARKKLDEQDAKDDQTATQANG